MSCCVPLALSGGGGQGAIQTAPAAAGHITIVRIKATQIAGVVLRQVPSPGARVATDGQITLTVPKAS